MNILEEENTKENFLLFYNDKEILYVGKFTTSFTLDKVKEALASVKEQSPGKIIEELVKKNIISIVVEPSSRFLTMKVK